MFSEKFVFSQLVSFLDRSLFNRIVRKYGGDRYIKYFTCWNQLLALMFGQLSNREGLRALIVVFEAHSSKCYHLGIGTHVTRSNLAKADENRDFRIFRDFAFHMIEFARKKRSRKIFGFKGHVYAFDSTTIDLCLELFEWARFRTTKGGVKVHTLLDVETQIPSFLLITEAKQNDVKAMDFIPYEASSYYVFDRAYNDFGRLARIDAMGCFFVVRAKMNMQYEVFDTKEKLADNILKDCRIILTGNKTGKLYSKPLRMVEYYDAEDKRVFTYLTNSNKISASRVAELYKNRWLVELFFKWLKQHLKIKKFWGTSENAVKIQIYVAIITYCLVAIVHHDMQLNRSLYEILQILGISLTDKTPLQELLTAKNSEKQEKAENRTLDLFDDLFLC